MLRDLDGPDDSIDLKPPAKSPADQMIVDHDLVQRQTGGFRRGRLDACNGLAADPDFATIVADMHCAIHRLHGRVREERELVGCLDLGDGAREGFVDIADVLSHRPRIECRLFELSRDLLRVEPGVCTVIPFDHQRRQPLLRCAHMVGDDGDGVVKPHNLTHTFDGLGRRIVYALQSAAEDRRLRQCRDLHAGRPHIDAIDGRPIDLGRGVDSLGRCADQRKILWLLQRYRVWNGHVCCIGGKLAIFEASPGRRVKHFTALHAAGRMIDIPALCRRRHQHGSRSRTCLAQGLPCRAYRIRIAGRLDPAQ